jgi:hypothetical protein
MFKGYKIVWFERFFPAKIPVLKPYPHVLVQRGEALADSSWMRLVPLYKGLKELVCPSHLLRPQ